MPGLYVKTGLVRTSYYGQVRAKMCVFFMLNDVFIKSLTCLTSFYNKYTHKNITVNNHIFIVFIIPVLLENTLKSPGKSGQPHWLVFKVGFMGEMPGLYFKLGT